MSDRLRKRSNESNQQWLWATFGHSGPRTWCQFVQQWRNPRGHAEPSTTDNLNSETLTLPYSDELWPSTGEAPYGPQSSLTCPH